VLPGPCSHYRQRASSQPGTANPPIGALSAQVTALLEAQPDAREIQVERVKFLRYGEARGDYDQVVAALNHADPHGK
jgi:uncharacterized oxidoreductase